MTAPQDVLDAMARLREQANRPPASAGDTAADVGLSAAGGGASALTTLAGMPADLLNFLSRNIPQGAVPFFPTAGRPSIAPQQTLSTQITGERRAVPPVQAPGTSQDIQNLARLIPGVSGLLDYQPQTDAGRYARTGAEWAVPAMLAGPGGLVRRGITGLLGGEASQGATDVSHQIVPPAYRPYVDPVVGGVAGLLTMGRINAPMLARANPSAVVREAAGDITPADWARAQARMDAAPPGTLLPVEALGSAGAPLQGLASDVAATRAGGPITQAIANRSAPTVQGAEQAIAAVGGPPRAAADVVRDVSEGARNVIGEARTARSRASEPYYSAAETEQVPLGAFNPIIRNINDRVARVGADSEIGRALTDLRDRLISASSGTTVNVGPVSMLARETRNGIYPRPPGQTATVVPPRAMTATEQGVIGPVVDEITETLERLNPNFRTAQDLFRTNSPRVDAVRQPDVMGNIQAPVTETTRVPATLAQQAEILTGEGVTPQQINRVFGELSMSNQPQAARDLGATLLRSHLNEAAGRTATSPDAPMTAGKFWAALMGNPDAAARTEAIIRGMARANGQNPDQVWTGWSRMLDAFAQTGRIPAIGSRTAPRGQLARDLGGNWVSTLLDTANLTRGSALATGATRFAERVARADYATLADAFSNPDGIRILRDMAGQIPNSPRARMMATRFLELGRQGDQALPDQR